MDFCEYKIILKKIIIYIQQEYSKLIHLHDEQILLVIINEPILKS